MNADDAWSDPGWKQAALDHVKDANGKAGNDLGAILDRKLAEQRAEQEARIQEMAARDPVAYDQHRKKWAKDLGIRTATLDTEVQKRRRQPTKKPSDDEAEFRARRRRPDPRAGRSRAFRRDRAGRRPGWRN